jgi:hypothetical protein
MKIEEKIFLVSEKHYNIHFTLAPSAFIAAFMVLTAVFAVQIAQKISIASTRVVEETIRATEAKTVTVQGRVILVTAESRDENGEIALGDSQKRWYLDTERRIYRLRFRGANQELRIQNGAIIAVTAIDMQSADDSGALQLFVSPEDVRIITPPLPESTVIPLGVLKVAMVLAKSRSSLTALL